jgi:hypothetical protein
MLQSEWSASRPGVKSVTFRMQVTDVTASANLLRVRVEVVVFEAFPGTFLGTHMACEI